MHCAASPAPVLAREQRRRLAGDSRAGRAERTADRETAAVEVDGARVQAEFAMQASACDAKASLISSSALERSLPDWRQVTESASGDPLAALSRAYLSSAHRDRPGAGCVVAALGAETAPQGPALRHAVTTGVRAPAAMLAGLVPGQTTAAKRERVLATFAAMVGALVRARAVDDSRLLQQILQSVTTWISGAD